MTEMRWSTEQVWSELGKEFDPATINRYKELEATPKKGFEQVKADFERDVALRSRQGDINTDEARQQMILGHVLLAMFQAMMRGGTDWLPFPSLEGRRWIQKENELLFWSAKHGNSDS